MIADDIRITQNFGGGKQAENDGPPRALDFEAVATALHQELCARKFRTVAAHEISEETWRAIINVLLEENHLRRKERKG